MEQFASLKRSKDGQPVRFLVVDDSVFARKNLARIVEAFGGQVAGEAGDGMTAITEYDRTNPDIVLMDIALGAMSGWEATRLIKQQPETADIPIIALTAHALSSDRAKSIEAGCAEFETKPIDLQRLLAKIDACLKAAA